MKRSIIRRVTLTLVVAVSLAYSQTQPAEPTAADPRIDEQGSRTAKHATSRIRRVTTPQVPEPATGTWSNCLTVNGVVYISGMVARDKNGKVVAGDEYEQAKLIFAKIRNLVEAAGGTMADVVKITIFVTDITQREKVWRARREAFTGDFPRSLDCIDKRPFADRSTPGSSAIGRSTSGLLVIRSQSGMLACRSGISSKETHVNSTASGGHSVQKCIAGHSSILTRATRIA